MSKRKVDIVRLEPVESVKPFAQKRISFEKYCEMQDSISESYPELDYIDFPSVEELKKFNVQRDIQKYAKYLEWIMMSKERPEQKEARSYINEMLSDYWIIKD